LKKPMGSSYSKSNLTSTSGSETSLRSAIAESKQSESLLSSQLIWQAPTSWLGC